MSTCLAYAPRGNAETSNTQEALRLNRGASPSCPTALEPKSRSPSPPQTQGAGIEASLALGRRGGRQPGKASPDSQVGPPSSNGSSSRATQKNLQLQGVLERQISAETGALTAPAK
jgi:hypothetical protein